jgi:subtilisin family serine protease
LQAARALRQAGVFVVVSAGNAGPGCGTVSDPLAIYDEVLSVGAIDDAGSLAFFSSVGPVTADGSLRVKPDILAPGVEVLSSFPDETYEKLDGTSMAGPHVAGVVALMWSANPALRGDVERTEQILFDTASEYAGRPPACGSQGRLPHNGTGYGVVNAYLAVKAALEFSE